MKTRYIAEQKCAPDAVHDAWIATGRRSNNSLTAGSLLRLRDVLSSSALSKENIEYIHRAQGIEHYRRQKIDLKTDALITVIYSTKPIAKGHIINLQTLKLKKVKTSRCPSDALGDLWIAADRRTTESINAGGLVYYHSVIPQAQWKSWLDGDSR